MSTSAGSRPASSTAFAADGPWDPDEGLRFDATRLLLDPYGRGVATPTGYRRVESGDRADDTPAMKSVVVDTGAYDWEGDRPLGHSVARDDRLRDAPGGLHRRLQLRPAGRPARDVRRLHRQDPVSGRARDHRRRAAAGLRVRPPGRAGRPGQLLGLPARVVLRPARRVRQRGTVRRPRSTSSATWSRRSTGPASRSSSTSSTTTPRRSAPTARRSRSAAWPTTTTTSSMGPAASSTTAGPATRSTPTARSCAG